MLADLLPPAGADPVDVVDACSAWAAAGGRPLYPHQEEAALALAGDEHVVLATPTGSGKSLAATIGVALALNRGERAVWTAPIKALVAEKFFELVGLFGADRVGLATGDAAINTTAPVLVCTAEVLANRALTDGADTDVGFACLDEFHYYGDRDRGWAWQIPLLELHRTQFLLASATLGDVTPIVDDLQRRTGRGVVEITSVQRPNPLYHQWRMTTVADSVSEAVDDGLSPVYVVHGTQVAAIERAQALSSLQLTTREQREQIAAALGGDRLTKGFGKTLGRLLANGIGVHHAGMLPRYRRLVERLAGDGLLAAICGTDTLGVGVNIPIRTVLLTALTKFDGTKVRVFTAREFHQLAGRAGRPGFDPDGHVWAQAPDHVIANIKALSKAGDDAKARRKVVKAKPPERFVHYDEDTFNRLIAAAPEPLRSRFKVDANLVATVLARPDGPDALKALLADNHDGPDRRRVHQRRAIAVYRSLEAAGVAERRRDADGRCVGVRIGSLDDPDVDDEAGSVDEASEQRHRMQLSSPLAPFAIEMAMALDRQLPDYDLDLISVIESVLDEPRQVLLAQRDAARSAAIAAMKADGVEYEERMERLETITWPQPLAEFVDSCYDTYRQRHPWIAATPAPKSIVREMLEGGDTFATFVQRYRLERSEGLVLRYLADTWRALSFTMPPAVITPTLADIGEWLAAMIRATDATLLDEWELLATGEITERTERDAPTVASVPRPPAAWKTTLRTAVFGWVELLATHRDDEFAERSGWAADDVDAAMAPYRETYDAIEIHADARSAAYFDLDHVADPESSTSAGRWVITQRLVDPDGDGEWRLVAEVDLDEALADGAPTLQLTSLGTFTGT